MQSLLLWPQNPVLSIAVLWLVSVVLMWAARAAMLDLLRRLGSGLEEGLGAAARACASAASALRERSLNIYRHLTAWLTSRSEAQIDVVFEALGRQRFGEQIPLEELVYAVILTRQHVRDRVRRLNQAESAIELHYELDLDTMMGMFFDRALYATVKGYELARRVAAPIGERSEQWAKFGARGAWVP